MLLREKIVSEVSQNIIDALREGKLLVLDPVHYKPVIPAITNNKRADEEEFILLLSDFQVGIKTRTYNFKVFRQRMKNLTRNVLKVLRLHRRSHPVQKLNVFLMGDLVHNENIFRFVDLDDLEGVVKQQLFEVCLPELINFFVVMLANFKEINVWTVHGNHGSLGKLQAKSTNLDDIAYYFLAEVFKKNKRITFHLTQNFYNIAEIKRFKFLIVHGDTIKMHYQIPYYGITTRLMRWRGSIGDFDYLVMGHFHTAAVIDWNDKTIFMNGTFLSDDEWTIQRLGLSSSLCQLLLGLHHKWGVSFVRKIFLID